MPTAGERLKQQDPVDGFHGVLSIIMNRPMDELSVGSPGGTRTPDKAVNSRLLYQLSYRGMVLQENDREQSQDRFETG